MLGKKLFFKIFFRFYCEEQKSHCGSKKKALPLHSTDLTPALSQGEGAKKSSVTTIIIVLHSSNLLMDKKHQ